jgi:hypothetical protein
VEISAQPLGAYLVVQQFYYWKVHDLILSYS